ncbi:Mitochondrial import inner membrane translocase subunit Tim21 [Taenia crassiceps]|uniref:TIM21-like protein, mitochondrial n=1 Tax=Taenia crassiceps TaxID=6207 RepID=A0ABR4Q736_9CEST
MLRRAGGERGSFKKVSIVENQMDGNLRRLQENILAEIRNRSAFPLRKVAKGTQQRQKSPSDPIQPRQHYPSGGATINPQHQHASLIRTNSLFEEPQISLSDSNSFPLPSPPLPSPPPPDLLPSLGQPVLEQSNFPKTSEKSAHSYSSLKSIVRFHENSLEQGNQEQSMYRLPNLRCHVPRSTTHPCQSIRIPSDPDEGADITIRPPSPPLKYSPSEGNFRSSFVRQPSLVTPRKQSAHDISPAGSDVDEAISKAENRKKQAEMRCMTLQRIRKPSGGRLLNLQDPPSPLTYFCPHPQPSVVKYCVTSNEQVEEEGKNKNERIVPRPLQIREPPKIFATRGVTPFRRLSRISTSSSSSASPVAGAAAQTDGSSSIDEEVPGGQHGKWLFPTRRSIYIEGSQQEQYGLRNRQRKQETSAMPNGEMKPPHHYTGPGMFRGLSPRLPTQLGRSRERRFPFASSTRSLFCPLTNQSETTRSSNKVDRMVSPIPSPRQLQPSASVYGTLDRFPHARNRSGIFNPSQNDYDSRGFSTWRSSQFYSGVTAGCARLQIKQSASDAWYSTVIVGGIALTGFIFYVIVNELFSTKSPTRVYEEALAICTSDARVRDLLGEPITGCGESTRRGRRTHIASSEWYDSNGKKHLALRFYLKGAYASGTVHLEVYEADSKELVYRYLVVEADGLSRRQVILRPEANTPATSSVVPPPPPPPSTLPPFGGGTNEK